MSQPRPSLFARLQAARARITASFRSEPKSARAVLRCEAMEDRSMPAVVSGLALLDTFGATGPQQGVAGAQVTLTPTSGGSLSLTATSDANGAFTFGDIASGSYAVAVSAPAGYSVKTETLPGTVVVGDDAVSMSVGLVGQGTGSGSGQVSSSASTSTVTGGDGSGSGSGGTSGGGESGSGSGSGSGSSSASVGGTAWFDADADGVFDTDEWFAGGVGVTRAGSG